ncbi:MAG: FliA/WhiG family RNA polymerase sigma factor [Planctomycetota bacterium]
MASSDDPVGLFDGAGSGPRPAARLGRPRRETGEEGKELLRRYARRRSVAIRNRLVEMHRDIVEAIARSLALRLPPTVDLQDLIHAGMWGLMQAIDKYDATRSDQFIPFMRIRVRGAMLDELRNMDFLPRLQRRRIRAREAAMARLRAELARDPSEAELAQELGISLDQLRRSYSHERTVKSPGRMTRGEVDREESPIDSMDRLPDDDSVSPLESISRQDLLAKIQSSLEPVEWRVLQMHYFEGMSGKEVARRLRLSASRICQIHGHVLDRLKQRLQPAS